MKKISLMYKVRGINKKKKNKMMKIVMMMNKVKIDKRKKSKMKII
jgi:hypothetical protein